MCYRYALSVRPEIKERFNINDLPLGLETQYNIALQNEIPVVVKWEYCKILELISIDLYSNICIH